MSVSPPFSYQLLISLSEPGFQCDPPTSCLARQRRLV
jgi:hypothetical protein